MKNAAFGLHISHGPKIELILKLIGNHEIIDIYDNPEDNLYKIILHDDIKTIEDERILYVKRSNLKSMNFYFVDNKNFCIGLTDLGSYMVYFYYQDYDSDSYSNGYSSATITGSSLQFILNLEHRLISQDRIPSDTRLKIIGKVF